jgi:hypothetical protein
MTDEPSSLEYLEGAMCGLTLGAVFWFQFLTAFSKELVEACASRRIGYPIP